MQRQLRAHLQEDYQIYNKITGGWIRLTSVCFESKKNNYTNWTMLLDTVNDVTAINVDGQAKVELHCADDYSATGRLNYGHINYNMSYTVVRVYNCRCIKVLDPNIWWLTTRVLYCKHVLYDSPWQ